MEGREWSGRGVESMCTFLVTHLLRFVFSKSTHSHPPLLPPSPTPTLPSSNEKKSIATFFLVFQENGLHAMKEIAGQGKVIP